VNQILGILFFAGAAAWSYRRHQRERDWIKPVLVCLFCTWWLASVMCPFFKVIRNPVYVVLAVLSFTWNRSDRSSNWTILFHPALFCFVALIAASILWAVNPEDVTLRVVGLLLVFVFIWNLLRSTDLNQIATWLADGLLYASYATIVLIAVGGGASNPAQGGERLNLGDDLQATGTAALCLWSLVRLFAEGVITHGKRRIFHFILAAVALVAMIRTGTRGTLIQLVIVLPLLSTIRLPVKRAAALAMRCLLLAVVMLAAGAAIWSLLGEEKQSKYMTLFRIDKDDGVKDSRSFVWIPAIQKAKERPWLGRGLGSSSFFMFSDDEYRDSSYAGLPYRTTVHSQYLEIFYEFGVLGFLVFIWLQAALLRNVVRIYSYGGPQAALWRVLAIYSVVGVAEGLTHGGQITTGELNMIQRWLLYCCVLTFPLAFASHQQSAVSRLKARLRASQGKQVSISQPLQMAQASHKVYTSAKRVWPRHSPFRRLIFK
jgi:O-antigen ligase